MGQRRPSLEDVLTLQQYRSLLKTAPRIKDKKEGISVFFFVSMLGRVGLRMGEAVHMTRDWFKSDRNVVAVPKHENCDCGDCRHLARQYAEGHEEVTFEEALDEYWKVKDGSSGDVPVETEREIEIIELYFDEVPYTTISYSTVLRRLKKVGELTDGVNGARLHASMMRATAATHYVWAGARPPTLDVKFRWQDEKTKENYCKKTGKWAMQDLSRLRSTEPSDNFELRSSPPTYSKLRPDDEEDLIEVETWTPECEVPSHPRYQDDEEWLQEELGEFVDPGDSDRGQVSAVAAPGLLTGVTPTVLMTSAVEGFGGLLARPLARLSPVSPFQWAKGSPLRKGLLCANLYLFGLAYMVHMFVERSVAIDPATLDVSGVSHLALILYLTIVVSVFYLPSRIGDEGSAGCFV